MPGIGDLLKRIWDGGGREAAAAAGFDLLSRQSVGVQTGIGRAVAAMHMLACACGEPAMGGCVACGQAFCGQHGLVQLGPAFDFTPPAGTVLPGLCGACGNKAFEALRGGARKAADTAWNGVRRAVAREDAQGDVPPTPPPPGGRRAPQDMPPPYDPGIPPPPPGAGYRRTPGDSRAYEPPRAARDGVPDEVRRAYRTLGLRMGTSIDDVRRKQKKLAAKHHPDVRGGSLERMQEINAAVDVIERWQQHRKAA